MTSIFEDQPPKQGLFQSKQGVVLGSGYAPGSSKVASFGPMTGPMTFILWMKFGHFEEARTSNLI